MTELKIARGAGTALWRQIAERMERDIVECACSPGEKLPTEMELAEKFGVNRHTVRRAVAALAEQGLVRVEQGRGTFVQESVLDYRVKKRTRFSENVKRHNKEPTGRILAVREEPADAATAKALALRAGTMLVVVERLSEVDGRPASVSTHYFPKARFPGLAEIVQETGSITAAMERLGLGDYTRSVTKVTARAARAGDAEKLRQPPTKPILMTESVNVDRAKVPVEYSVARWAPDRVQIIIETEE